MPEPIVRTGRCQKTSRSAFSVIAIVKASLFDDTSWLQPAERIFCQSAQRWLNGGVGDITLANALRLLLGLWVMDAPFIYAPLGISAAAIWNDLIVGGCVVMLATMRLVFIREARAFRIAHLLLGSWIVGSPWLFGYTDDPLYFWNSLVCGTLIAALAVWSLIRYRAA